MYAAVVRTFDAPPRFDVIDTPRPSGEHEILVDVLAAGLHPRVRSGANGSHYTSDGVLPLIPGIDAVGRTEQGELLYFVAPDGAPGTMAEQTVVDRRRAITLPAGTDPVAVAAAMNPGMSSWVALRRRVTLRPGAVVLVLGATGNAGQLAVRIAKHLGAAHVVAAGRDPERLDLLAGLGADETVSLLGDPGQVADRLGKPGLGSPPPESSPNCPPSPRRSPPAPWPSTPSPFRCPRSSRPGACPRPPAGASC
jgi:NADPH:quinone reductase-like Zn-dependent oxidoreductase